MALTFHVEAMGIQCCKSTFATYSIRKRGGLCIHVYNELGDPKYKLDWLTRCASKLAHEGS